MNKVVLFALGMLGFVGMAQQSPNALLHHVKTEVPRDAVSLFDADAVILDEIALVEYEFSEETGFKIIQKVKRSIQINTADGLHHATLSIPFYYGRYAKENVVIDSYEILRTTKEKQEVISVQKATNTKVSDDFYLKEVAVENIQVGDIVTYSYSKEIPSIDEIPTWYFQGDLPKLKSSYTVMIPDNLLYLISKTGSLEIRETKEETQTARDLSTLKWGTSYRFKEAILKFTATNIPVIQYEPFMDNIQNYVSSIRFDLIQFQYPMSPLVTIPHEQGEVAKDLYKNKGFGGELRQDKYWKKTIANLALDGLDEPSKVERILAFIQQSIKWNQQYSYLVESGVKKAMTQQKGNSADINLALIGALRAAGIDAEPVVLSTKSNGKMTVLFPRFINHVIAGVKLNNQFYLLDAIQPYTSLQVLPIEDLNGDGWMITDKNRVIKVDLAPKQLSFNQEEFKLTLDEMGKVTGSMNSRLTRYEAFMFNSKYAESIVARSRADIEVRSKQFFLSQGEITPTEIGDVDYQFQVQKFNFATLDAQSQTMTFNPMELYRDKENPFLSETRQSDVCFLFPFMDVYKMNIQLPAGYKVKHLPANSVLTSKAIGMNMTYEIKVLDTNQLQIGFGLRMTNTVVPKQQYEDLRRLYQDMNQKMNELIVLEKITN